jgi:hypothetical protein
VLHRSAELLAAGDWISPEQGLKASEFRQIELTRPIERSAEAAPSQMPSPPQIRLRKAGCEGKRLIMSIKKVLFVME